MFRFVSILSDLLSFRFITFHTYQLHFPYSSLLRSSIWRLLLPPQIIPIICLSHPPDWRWLYGLSGALISDFSAHQFFLFLFIWYFRAMVDQSAWYSSACALNLNSLVPQLGPRRKARQGWQRTSAKSKVKCGLQPSVIWIWHVQELLHLIPAILQVLRAGTLYPHPWNHHPCNLNNRQLKTTVMAHNRRNSVTRLKINL